VIEDAHFAARRAHAAHDRPHKRALPRAIRSEEAEDFAVAKVEGDAVERATAGERLRDIDDLYGEHGDLYVIVLRELLAGSLGRLRSAIRPLRSVFTLLVARIP